jgi:membrane protein DedA with SNARE-associated domain
MGWILAAISFDRIENWLIAGGYVMLFGLLFMCGLGLPMPEDIPLLAAGALIAAGKMNLGIAAICAWCGIIGGDIMLYRLGRSYGLQITKVPFVGKHVTVDRIQRVEQMFTKYGVWVVAVGRLFAGIRGAMVIAAGAIRYNFLTFIIADGLAALISGGLWVALGYWLGNRIKDHMADIDRWKHYIAGTVLVVAILTVMGIYLWKRRKKPPTVPVAML